MGLLNPNFSFNTITARQIIDEAYLICGVQPEQIENKELQTALFSIKSLITEWINESILQFNEIQTLVKLSNNCTRYGLPERFYDIYDYNLASFGRQRSGTAYSNNGGIAANVFDNNLTTSCTQTSQNGTIGINFSSWKPSDPTRVDFIGILSNKDTPYQIVLEGSNDNVNWTELFRMDRPYDFKSYPSLFNINWFQVQQPQIVQYLQIREIGGNTLDIRELYFEQYINSTYRTEVGRSTYMQMANRDTAASPTVFSKEKQANQIIINTYLAPSQIPPESNQDYSADAYYNNFILMRAVEYPLDVNLLSDPIKINRLFIPALEYGLAAKLALRTNRYDIYPILSQEAQVRLQKAKMTNNDLGGMSFQKFTYKA